MALSGPTVTVNGRTVPLDPRVLVRAGLADVRSMPRALRLWFAALLGLLGVAAVAALIALPPGWEVFGTTPSFEWGLLIVGYVFFAITTSGLCLTSSLGTVFGIDRYRPLEKRHAILAVLCLTSAFGIIVLDLHYPIRLLFGAVLSPSPTSPMWWMGVFYGGYLAILLVEVWSMFWNHAVIHQWACTLAACMAIVAPFTLGAVFGVVGAHAYWHGIFTPIQMVVTAFVAGASLLCIVLAVVVRLRLAGHERARRLAIPGLRLLLGIGLLAVAALVARQLVVGLDSDERGMREATEAVMFGPDAAQFWILRVGVGIITPLVLIALPWTRTDLGTLVAGVCGLVGVFFDRVLLVSGGQAVPVSAHAGVVSSPYAAYTPSPVEIVVVLGAGAFVALGYTLAERYLDLGEADVHAGVTLRPLVRRLREAVVSTRRRASASPPVPAGTAREP